MIIFKKAQVAEYALKNVPTTIVQLGFYFQNFDTYFAPEKAQDGTHVYTFPKTSGKLDGFNVEDLGEAVVNIANNRETYLNKTISLSAERLSIEEFIEQIGEVSGVKTRIQLVSDEEYAKKFGKEMQQMFAWIDQYGSFGPNSDESVKLGKNLAPNAKTFKQYWQAAHK